MPVMFDEYETTDETEGYPRELRQFVSEWSDASTTGGVAVAHMVTVSHRIPCSHRNP